jgi:uncharacterized surface protein with fasciclin (FAS1) repeats
MCAAAPTTLPSANDLNIVQLAESVKDLSTLVTAVVHANLTAALEGGAAAVILEIMMRMKPNNIVDNL